MSTHRVGVLFFKAYITLITEMSRSLLSQGIVPKEWALLGFISEFVRIKPKDAAREIGVEASYITAMATRLKKRGLVREERDTEDSRAKYLCLTKEGSTFVSKTEPLVRADMRSLIAHMATHDILSCLMVLENIIINGSITHKNYNV